MSGIWTEHVDPMGRPYYYNMRLQRSSWVHPDLQELVNSTTQEAPKADLAKPHTTQSAGTDAGEPKASVPVKTQFTLKRKLPAATVQLKIAKPGASSASHEARAPSGVASAAAAAASTQEPTSAASAVPAAADKKSEYLNMLQQMKADSANDNDAGGKWLVR